MSLLIIVPARGGSKRLPGKNMRLLGGRTLLEHTANAILESGIEATCVLTTDDEHVADHGRSLGWQVPFLRPVELAQDESSTEAAVLHSLDWYACAYDGDPEALMVLQPTSPLRRGERITQAKSLLDAHGNAKAVLGVRRLGVSTAHVLTLSREGFLQNQGEAVSVPAFIPNGAMYLVRSDAFREVGSLTPLNTMALEMGAAESIDIDTEDDWRMAEAVLAGLPHSIKEGPVT